MNTSERITLLRFPLIVAVVFIHAYGSQVNFAGGTTGADVIPTGVQFTQELLSQTIARIAVPLFFAMSGFLFFLTYDGLRGSYARKLRSRVRSLLVPYVLWNTLVILLLAMALWLPATRDYFSGHNKPIAAFHALDYVNAYLGHGARSYPIAYPFWFIRDLMLLVLLTPLIHLLIRRALPVTLAVSAVAWLLVDYHHTLLLDPGAWLFFVVGAAIATHPGVLAQVDRMGLALVTSYVIVAPIDALLGPTTAGMLMHKLGIVIGLGAAWYGIGLLRDGGRAASWLLKLSTYAFFVFAAHEPLLTTIKKVSYKLIGPQQGLSIVAIYLAAPILTVLITLGVGACLHRIAPRLFGILCGGRANT